MQTLHFTCYKSGGKELAKRLRKDKGRNVVFMDWADSELVDAFNAGKYTDLVTTYIAAATGFRANAEAIVHYDLPPGNQQDPFVVQANNRAPGAAIVYRFKDHFEYEGYTV
ncbi:MAG: hypothetical protein GY794_16085 [bacterium]|nr:hypothetical protein [bacterium]